MPDPYWFSRRTKNVTLCRGRTAAQQLRGHVHGGSDWTVILDHAEVRELT